MVLSTAQVRTSYGPACRDNSHNFLAAYKALNACFKKHNYRVGVNSGAFACRRITGGTGYSLHSYPDFQTYTWWNGQKFPAIAVACDINSTRNPYGPRLITDMPRAMIDDIYKIRTNRGDRVFGWGGYYRVNKDAMHFEFVCSKASLNSGINPRTVPGAAVTAPKPTGASDVVRIYWFKNGTGPRAAYRCILGLCEKASPPTYTIWAAYWIPNAADLTAFRKRGYMEITTAVPTRPSFEIHNGPYDNTKVV